MKVDSPELAALWSAYCDACADMRRLVEAAAKSNPAAAEARRLNDAHEAHGAATRAYFEAALGASDAIGKRIADVERLVQRGELLLARQRKTIDELRRGRHDIELACELLDKLEESQRLLIARLEQLLESVS